MLGILLSAGFSRRFGTADKLLQPMPDGCPMALVCAQTLVEALPTSIAVVRADNKALAQLLSDAGLHVVFCENSETEMADSLVKALRFSATLTEADEGFVIALADMPYIATQTVQAVAHTLSTRGGIVMPSYQDKPGHPVGFAAKFRSELEGLRGDTGARAVIKRHAHEVYYLATQDAGILADIDTLADFPS
jgi:molybdenum cofactor cytidylyltransferase